MLLILYIGAGEHARSPRTELRNTTNQVVSMLAGYEQNFWSGIQLYVSNTDWLFWSVKTSYCVPKATAQKHFKP